MSGQTDYYTREQIIRKRNVCKKICKAVKLAGFEYTSKLMAHSLQDNPSDLWFDEKSKLSRLIKDHKVIKDLISWAQNKYKGEPVTGCRVVISFSSGDLYLSLHNVRASVNEIEKNGKTFYRIHLLDIFDFEDSCVFENIPIGYLNHVAYVYQQRKVVVPFTTHIIILVEKKER